MKRYVTTPPIVSGKIKELADEIKDNAVLTYIPCNPFPDALHNECFPNVERTKNTHGGEAVNGWVIWQRGNVLIEAEAHSVWKSHEGVLIDITPHNHGENKILFLQDDFLVV